MGCTRSRGSHGLQCLASLPRPGEPGLYPTQPMPAPRLHIEFASGSSMAAILRRGPSGWVRLALWDTATDQVDLGSWFHGRIYEDCCSLSPDGRLFAYLAAKHQGNRGSDDCSSWAAVSRPPWLTAIAFWPQRGTQGVKAEFVDNATLLISHPNWDKLTPTKALPDAFSVISRFTGRSAPEQSLPIPPKSDAKFSDNRGVDQQGRAFDYIDGRLVRDSMPFADFTAMQPDPESSPDWARQWPSVG